MGNIEKFIEHVGVQVELFREKADRGGILLLHHNDCDGLTSGATLYAAFDRAGFKTRGYSLEKPYPKVLHHIFADPLLPEETVIVIADFGSGMLPTLSK